MFTVSIRPRFPRFTSRQIRFDLEDRGAIRQYKAISRANRGTSREIVCGAEGIMP